MSSSERTFGSQETSICSMCKNIFCDIPPQISMYTKLIFFLGKSNLFQALQVPSGLLSLQKETAIALLAYY
jgi:hypothetical protein